MLLFLCFFGRIDGINGMVRDDEHFGLWYRLRKQQVSELFVVDFDIGCLERPVLVGSTVLRESTECGQGVRRIALWAIS